jgi:uncharacterized repeat protein (TIGR01451 family)
MVFVDGAKIAGRRAALRAGEMVAAAEPNKAKFQTTPSRSTASRHTARRAIARCATVWLATFSLLVSGCTTGPFASNRPMGGESFSGNCVTGGLKKGCGCGPKICKPKPAVPAAPASVPGMRIMPSRLVAPVGSEVIVVAGACGEEGKYLTHERIEWTLDSGSVGQFIAPGERHFPHNLVNNIEGGAEKLAPNYAVGTSSHHVLTLTRGTATAADDVLVKSGQAWVTVTAATEGTSHVTAYAPGVKAWTQHRNTSTIHWVDAAWQFPPPAMAQPGGRQSLTTTVMRNTDRSPIAGWVVRYEVVNGPAAGFGANLDPAIEAVTDAAGQATVEIAQRSAANGVNQINIQVIRPGDPNSGIQSRLALGAGTVTQTWGTGAPAAPPASTIPQPTLPPNAPPPATNPPVSAISIRALGPAQSTIGGALSYTLEVSNNSAAAVRGVSVSAAVPTSLAYQSSTPPATGSAAALVWQLGDLGAGEQGRRILVNFQPRVAGSIQFCADALVGNALAARACATTTIGQAQPLALQIRTESGASQFRVGDNVTFLIAITNQGSVPVSGLSLRDTFDVGLQHEESARTALVRNLEGTIGPGQVYPTVGVNFKITQPGRLCHTVEITATGGYSAVAKACIDATGAAGDTGGAPATGAIQVRVSGPPTIGVNQRASYLIEVTNRGPTVVENLAAIADFDPKSLAVSELLGFANVNNRAVWRIARLEAGRTISAQIQFAGIAANPSATCGADVLSGNELVGGARVNVAVIGGGAAPAGGQLTLTVSDLVDPARLGEDLKYIVNIQNDGRADENDVVLEIVLPQGTTLASQLPDVESQQGNTIRFKPIASLPPARSETISILVKAAAPGDYTLRASAVSRSTTQPVRAENRTTVQPR